MQATMANLRKHLDTLSEKLHKVCFHINPEAKLYSVCQTQKMLNTNQGFIRNWLSAVYCGP